jgi:sugar-specific transcriptional regulator TrmB
MENELKDIGMTEYEMKSYQALLKYGAMSGRETARKSGVPPTRVFDILRLLEEKGFVFTISQKPMIFQAVKPEIAVSGFVAKKIERLQNAEKSAVESLRLLERPEKEERLQEKIYVISGFEKMFEAVNLNTEKSTKELLVMSVGEKIPYSTEMAIRKAVRRGVKFRFISSRYDKENLVYLRKLQQMGAEVRHYKSENYSISVFDRKIASIIVKSPSNPKERIATFFESKDLAKALVDWFEVMWKKATPVRI